MKKILSLLLALVMLVTCFMALSACAPRPYLKDLEEAAENLKDAKYDVYYSDKEDELKKWYGFGVVEALDADDADDNELVVVVFETSKLARLHYEEKKLAMEYSKDSLEQNIKKVKHILKKYGDDLKSAEEDYYKELLEQYEEQLDMLKDVVIGISGKTVWYGTKDAIKASKG